jgi:metal-sulfur cluster biosynthetic enzyme
MTTKEEVYQAISTVIDPEVGCNLVELGLIYDAIINDDKVEVIMTLSTKGCPLHGMMQMWVKDAVLNHIQEVKECEVTLVWEPAWNISMASDEVKKRLGAL